MKWNKHRSGVLWSTLFLLSIACSSPSSREKEARTPSMIDEGMSAESVRKLLGQPDSTESGGAIYDVASGKKKMLERWYYPKRTIVMIDDTVKVANERFAR